MMEEEVKRGGKRPNSGRKAKAPEVKADSQRISFTVQKRIAKKAKREIKKLIKELELIKTYKIGQLVKYLPICSFNPRGVVVEVLPDNYYLVDFPIVTKSVNPKLGYPDEVESNIKKIRWDYLEERKE